MESVLRLPLKRSLELTIELLKEVTSKEISYLSEGVSEKFCSVWPEELCSTLTVSDS